MPTYRRETRIDAPLSVVWEFHSTVAGLEALTPGFMNLGIEAVEGPEGRTDPPALVEGSRIQMSMQPGGVVPTQAWTSVIKDRGATSESASFSDEMEGGPFKQWVHTHSFTADGDETVMTDRVEYQLPLGLLGKALGQPAKLGFEGMFRDRHRRTTSLLSGTSEVPEGFEVEGTDPTAAVVRGEPI